MAVSRPGRHPGADRGAPLRAAELHRVLVVRADNLGDVVMATPVLGALREFAPHARIDLLASPAGSAVAPMIPELDGVLTVSPSWQQLGGSATGDAERELVERVRTRRYDAMIVLTSFSQSPWPVAHVGLLAGVPVRAVHSSEFGGAVATHWVTPPADTTHQVDRGLHLLAALGIPDRGRAPRLRIPDADDRAGAALLGDLARAPFAVLVPGASCATRRYPAARFGAAAAAIAAAGLPVRVAGPAAEEALVAEVVATARSAGGARIGAARSAGGARIDAARSAGGARIDASGRPDVAALPPTTVPRFAAVVRRATVVVTNNSGGMHLADALGTPVAVAWAGTERPGDMNPRAVPAALLGAPVPCSPCRLLTCPYGHECLDVEPEALAAAACRLARGPEGEEEPWPPIPSQVTRGPALTPSGS